MILLEKKLLIFKKTITLNIRILIFKGLRKNNFGFNVEIINKN